MRRRLNGFTLIELAIVAAIALVLFAIYVGFGTGYDTRRWVSEAIGESGPVRTGVMSYRQQYGKWPGPAEAAMFKVDKSRLNRARSIAYESEKRAVVITMESSSVYAGKSFAFYGEDGADGPVWSCRPIDLETKYLPASCR